jgi:hypothetical protein
MTQMTDEVAERIDAFLGDGTYDTWNVLDWEARTQLDRAKRIEHTLWQLNTRLCVLAPYGTDWVEKLKNDLAWGLDLIKEEKFPDPAQFRPLLKIFPVALDAAELLMDYAEAIPVIWTISGAFALPVVGFTASVAQLRDDLLLLDKLLTEALVEQVEAAIKSAFSFVIDTVGLMVPGLGLLAKGPMSVVNMLLAGPTTASGKTQRAKGISEAVAEIPRANARFKKIAQAGGKPLTITGFYFEIQNLRHVRGKVDAIRRLLKKTNRKYKELQEDLKRAVGVYRFVAQEMDTRMLPLRKQADAKQSERDDLIRQYSYDLVQPVAWRIVEDWR